MAFGAAKFAKPPAVVSLGVNMKKISCLGGGEGELCKKTKNKKKLFEWTFNPQEVPLEPYLL